MADRSVFYAFSFHSPYSALADSRIDSIAEEAGCRLEPLPLVPPRPPAPEGVQALVAGFRWDYITEDSARWAAHLGLDWDPPPPPVVFGEAVRSTAAWYWAREQGRERAFRNAIFRARFGRGCDTEAEPVLLECAEEAGLDPIGLLAASGNAEFQQRGPGELGRMAEEKVFGVPLFVVGGARFFGNDRLDFLESHLAAL